MAKFKPGDVVRFTTFALDPTLKWAGRDRPKFIYPVPGEFVVAKYNNDIDVTLSNGASWAQNYLDLVREGDFSNVEMYLVGGAVRDRIMGNRFPHDLDFTIVAESFAQMQAYLIAEWGVETFVEKPEYGTVRGRFTPVGPQTLSRYFGGITLGTLAGDFVLSRKEGYYTDGRHPDDTTVGTLYDDLARRDFTMNAIAMDDLGHYHDPFNGLADIDHGMIRAVGNAKERFTEDALRVIRALRFTITKDFVPDYEVKVAMMDDEVLDKLMQNISVERIREELDLCFKHDVEETLRLLHENWRLSRAIFNKDDGHGLGLMPTIKKGY
jgi:tRNA nucleotidyltransferase (CCA-adding enzyme)